MKIKNDFILREVAGNYVVIALGDDALDFSGVITVNEVGAFIWKKLEEGISDSAAIAEEITKEYSVDRATALADCEEFLQTLKEHNITEE